MALGLLVSYTVYNRLRTSSGVNNEPGVDVVVALNDLQVGAKLEDHDIRVARFPQSVVPPGAFAKKAQVVGRGVVLPVSKGEFILPSKLAAVNAGSGLPSLIPPGMRAVSVRVNDVVSVAGFVQPGSRVDVLATGNQGGGNDRQTTTVLENVAVIAVGKNLERNATGDTQTAPVITLLVSPDDGQRLTLASQEGRIQLALRNPLDTRREGIGATRASSLYPGLAPVAIQSKPGTHRPTIPVTVVPSAYAVETIRGSKRDETKF